MTFEMLAQHLGDLDAVPEAPDAVRATHGGATHGACSSTKVAEAERDEVVAKAQSLLADYRPLEAELALLAYGIPSGAAFHPRLQRYLDMYHRVKEFTLAREGSSLTWTTVYTDRTPGAGATLELSWAPGAKSGWMRQVIEVQAPLDWCMVPSAEDWGSDSPEAITKDPIGPQSRLRRLNHVMLNFLMGFAKYDIVSENLRFPNHNAGFLAEHIADPDPEEDRSLTPLPGSPKGFTRIHASTYNLWLPLKRPDGKDATILVQVNKIDAGFKVPSWLLQKGFFVAAPQMIKKFRSSARLAAKQGPERKRLETDPLGFYGEVHKVMKAAQKRPLRAANGGPIDATNLPSPSIFDPSY